MKALITWLTCYKVIAYWEGMVKVHYAKTEREVHEWMACYPTDAVIAYGKRFTLLGGRGHHVMTWHQMEAEAHYG